MNFLRSFAAVAVGFFCSRLLSGMFFWLLSLALPNSAATNGTLFYLISIIMGSVIVMISGYITAVIAKRLEIPHGMLLGSILAIMGFVYYSSPDAVQQPGWFILAMAILSFPTAAIGAGVRARQRLILDVAREEEEAKTAATNASTTESTEETTKKTEGNVSADEPSIH